MEEDPRYQNEAARNPTPESSWGKLLRLVPKKARVLEIGCAFGSFSDALTRLNECRVVGVEIDAASAATAKSRVEQLFVGDVAALLKQGALGSGFDVVIAADVLEHLADPVEVLKGLAATLERGGALLCSIPNVAHMSVVLSLLQGTFPRTPEGLLDATHVHFYGERDVLELFRAAGYAVRIVDRVQLDPRLTEFKSDVSSVPAPVLDFLDHNHNSLTYQFIVRAVPRAWAEAADDEQATAAPQAPATLTHNLVTQVAKLEGMVGEYHRALTTRQEQAVEHERALAEAHAAVATLKKDNAAKDQLFAASEAAYLHEGTELRAQLAHHHDAVSAHRQEAASLRQEVGARQTLETALRAKTEALEAEYARNDVEPDIASLRVLYIAQRDDASLRYRCIHGAEQLRDAGVVANLARISNPDLLEQIPKYSLIVLFRLQWSERVEKVIEVARAAGVAVAFEIDDLIFHPAAEALMPFLKRTTPSDLKDYRRQFKALEKTVAASDVCIASTPTIARYARDLGKVAVVHPNLLPRHYLQLSRVIQPLRPVLQRTPLIGYMSGSKTHDGDFAQVSEALAQILMQRPEVSLLLVGPLHVPPKLYDLKHRIVQFPYQDHRVYPWLMARCRLLLAPLETTNDFANAKSPLKVFEAGVFGIPVVATRTQTYAEAIIPGVSGELATTTSEWVDAITKMLDLRTSLKLGSQARELALRRYSPASHRGALASKLARFAGRSNGQPVATSALTLPADTQIKRSVSPAAHAVEIARSSLSAAVRDPRLSVRAVHGHVSAALYAEMLDSGNEVSQALVAMPRDGRTLTDGAERLGIILADLENPLTPATDHVVATADRSRFQSVGNDPYFILPSVDSGPRQTLVVEMTVEPLPEAEVAHAQIFWRSPSEPHFAEARSLLFQLMADGQPHTYVLDLNPQLGSRWPDSGELLLRFDPMERPGEFEVSRIALLGKRPEGTVDVRRGLGLRFLAGDGVEIGALQNPMRVPPKARVQYVDRLSLAELRAHYPELDGQPLVDPSILAEADKLTPIEDETRDFVIANHVLEHLRDPLGGLKEWLRVLKPGGHLYVSVPDRTNPYDKNREVTTLGHLKLDHEQHGQRDAEDAAHAHDWTQSAHPEMSPVEQTAFSEKLIREKYDIHFHVFDSALFRNVLSEVCGELGELREFLSVGEEHFAVIRRRVQIAVAPAGPRGIDIVIPIYNARDFTVRCIESVLQHAAGDWRLILVNDASTQAGLAEDLAHFAAQSKRVVLLTNEKNLGFVMTANRGMREANGRDVLLLNSDTEVFAGFLERMREAAYAIPDTGILSPFSNNATLCSVPQMGIDNPIPEGFTPATFADLIAACSKQRRPELVTAVGFCMYVRAEVFAKIGYFDEVSYGRGFGEENDLCERAKKAGFTIRLADDVFVQHKGKASFGAEGKALESTNGKILEAKHPGYDAAVANFFAHNPLAPEHAEIRLQLKRLRRGAEEALLVLLHASIFGPTPGGTEFHVRDMIRSLKLPRVVVVYPDGASLVAAEVFDGEVTAPIFYRFPLSKPVGWFCIDDEEITAVVRHWVELFGIRAAHIQHLLFWPVTVAAALHELGVEYCYTSHDFYAVCPSWNLFDFEKRTACACVPGGAGCVPGTIKTMCAPEVDAPDLRARHRAAFLKLFGDARAVIFPSSRARDVARGHLGFDLAKAHVLPHGTDTVLTVQRPPRGERLRIAIVGEVAFPIKGADNYIELVKLCSGLPIDWHFFGTTNVFGFEERLRAIEGATIAFRGRYKRDEISDLLATSGVDLCVLLPEVDETFSFTLSESVIANIPVVAARKGALPERIEKGKFGILVSDVAGARDAIAGLCADPARLAELTEHARRFQHSSVADNAGALRSLYDAIGFAPKQTRPLPIRAELVQELAARRITPEEPALIVAPDADRTPQYQQSWWYPWFKKVKTLIPEQARLKGRQALLAREKVTRLHPLRRNELSDIDIIKKGRRTFRFESKSNDPFIVFDSQPFVAKNVRAVRFRLKHDLEHYAQAQLFWTHATGESFNELKSVKVPLQPGKWVEYAIQVDTPELRSAWQGGAEIVHVRFDPVDMPGAFEMGPLELVY